MFQSLRTSKKLALGLAAALALMLGNNQEAGAQISLTPSSLTYTQNFDAIDGTSATIPSALPGWTLSPNPLKGIDCGNASAGGIYAFGTSGSGEYALGYQPAGSGGNDTFYAISNFVNNTGSTIESVTISYNFERWRVGARTNGFMVTSDLGDVSALNQTGDPTTGSNCNVITTAKTVTLTGLSVPDGDTFYVTFSGNRGTGSGASQGVGIDDFVLSATLMGAPTITADTLTDFGVVCVGDTSAVQTVMINGSSLTGDVTVTAPSGFLLSTTATGSFSTTLILSPVSGSLSSTIYVLFVPAGSTAYTGQLTFASPGMTDFELDLTGTGNQILPTIMVDIDHDLNICEGTTITFSTTVTDGGVTPQIEWLVNGVPNGVTAPTFTTSSLDSGDVVSATLLSSESCAPDTAITSNSITVAIYPIVTPSITITATPAGPVPMGDPVTFNSVVTGVGMSPDFIWLVNGDSVTNGPAYTTDSLNSGDVVMAILYTDAPCATIDSALSNEITVMISTGVASLNQSSFSVSPNPSNGAFLLKGSLKGAGKDAQVTVYNALGQQAYQAIVPVRNEQLNTHLSLDKLPAGIYMLTIQSKAVQEHIRVTIRK